MAAPKAHRLLLVVALYAGSEAVALAVDLAAKPQLPVASAAPPRVAQTAQTAKAASLQVGSAPPLVEPPVGASSGATLWRFMGVPQGIQKLRGATTNRRGNFPGREPTPPLKAIADPRNLAPSNGPAIVEAAKIKQKEDLAPQKIKALKYLATIGCGCYPDVAKAFMDSLEFGKECTEEVRYEAALAVAKSADNKCTVCSKSCCCTAEMMNLLNKVATGKDEDGCFFEPSARVREAACEALMACRRRVRVYPATPAQPVVPPIDGDEELQRPQAPPALETRLQDHDHEVSSSLMDEILGGQVPRPRVTASPVATNKAAPAVAPGNALPAATDGPQATTVATSSANRTGAAAAKSSAGHSVLVGSIVGVDQKTSTLALEFEGRHQPTVGSQLSVHHDYALSRVYLGLVEVVYQADNGRVIARPLGKLSFSEIHKGDRVSGRVSADAEQVAQAAPQAENLARDVQALKNAATTYVKRVPPTEARLASKRASFVPQAHASAPALPHGASWTNAVPARTGNVRKRPSSAPTTGKAAKRWSPLMKPVSGAIQPSLADPALPADDAIDAETSPAGVVLLEE